MSKIIVSTKDGEAESDIRHKLKAAGINIWEDD